MSTPACCQAATAVPGRRTAPRRGVTGWVLPSVGLALLPKCPACLVGYAALAGIALPNASAEILHSALVAVCIGSLANVAARRVNGRSAFVV